MWGLLQEMLMKVAHITAPSPCHHPAITAPSLHHHCTITASQVKTKEAFDELRSEVMQLGGEGWATYWSEPAVQWDNVEVTLATVRESEGIIMGS